MSRPLCLFMIALRARFRGNNFRECSFKIFRVFGGFNFPCHCDKASVSLLIREFWQTLCLGLSCHAPQCIVIEGQYKLVGVAFMAFSTPYARALRPGALPAGYELFRR